MKQELFCALAISLLLVSVTACGAKNKQTSTETTQPADAPAETKPSQTADVPAKTPSSSQGEENETSMMTDF